VGKRIQFHLNHSTGQRHEVVTLGQEDWGQRQELEALKRHGPKLKPDLVITLFLSLNDVRNNSLTLEESGNRQLWSRDRPRPGWTHIPKEEAPLFLLEGSALNRLISFWLARLLSKGEIHEIPLDYWVYAKVKRPDWEAAWQETERLILETKDFSEGMGAPYALVSASTPQGVFGNEKGLRLLREAYPAMDKESWDLDGPDKKLEKFCENHDIPFLRLEPIFRTYTLKEGKRLHWRYDGHWNVEGNDLAGKHIAEFVHSLK
jgi:hypothetical protein